MTNIYGGDQFAKSLQAMTGSDDVNILLLGETGVGKSTFINAFANYLEYEKFNVAEKEKVLCLIPTKFTVTNENFEEKIIEIGKDDNENNAMTDSATLETRSYVFPIDKKEIRRIRLIDTPGIGNTRGIDQDNENMENILSYISHIENLHAICFLLKPNNIRLTVMFYYCIKRLLSRLEKSASKKIIFLFTNTRSTFYKPGETATPLKAVLNDIRNNPPFADIKFVKDNVFCLDNESFRYLAAIKNGVELGNKQSFVESWDHSVEECWRMLDYITGKGNSKLTPHKVKDTVSVNEARRIILQLSKPLADIADLINDNIKSLERRNQTTQSDNLSIESRKASYENEKDTIMKTMAKFTHFLQRNAIAPYNDPYKAYIEHLLDREKSQGDNCDFEMIKYYNDLLKRYSEERQMLDTPSNNKPSNVTATTVFDSVEALYKLPHTGVQIKNLHSRMIRNQGNEHEKTELFLEATKQQTTQKKVDNRNNEINSKQNQRQVVKAQFNPNNQPNMKVENRKSDSREQNANQQHFQPTWRRSIPDSRYKNMLNYVTGQNLYVQSPRAQHPQQQVFRRQFPIFQQSPSQNNPNQGFWGQQIHPNYAPHHGNLQNSFPQRGNFPNQGKSMQSPNHFNVPLNNYANVKSNTNASTINDPNFDKWYKNIVGESSNDPPGTDNTSDRFTRYNNLLKKEESSDNESNSNYSESAVTDDDEDFKEFMNKNNNFEYLMKASSGNSVGINEKNNQSESQFLDIFWVNYYKSLSILLIFIVYCIYYIVRASVL